MRKEGEEGQEGRSGERHLPINAMLILPITDMPVVPILPWGKSGGEGHKLVEMVFCRCFTIWQMHTHSWGLAVHVMPQGINLKQHNP